MNNSAERLRSLSSAPDCCTPAGLARGLAALAHPARVEILRCLAGADGCCCKDVVVRLPLAQSTVSQHLKVLLEAGLVRVEPQRQRSCYRIDRTALRALAEAVNGLVSECATDAAALNEEKS